MGTTEQKKQKQKRKTHLLKRYCFSLLSIALIAVGILYALCSRIFQTGTHMDRVKNISDLSEMVQINTIYTLDMVRDKSDGGFISYFEEFESNLTEECFQADVIAKAVPTGRIALHPDSVEMEVYINEVYKGSEYVRQDQCYDTYTSWAICPDETGSFDNYYGYLNLMYPEYTYYIFAKASSFQVNGQRELYFMGPLFCYMRTGEENDPENVLTSLDLRDVKASEYMTIDPEVSVYLNEKKMMILEKTGVIK